MEKLKTLKIYPETYDKIRELSIADGETIDNFLRISCGLDPIERNPGTPKLTPEETLKRIQAKIRAKQYAQQNNLTLNHLPDMRTKQYREQR